MVKSHSERTENYVAGLNPLSIYLMLKRQRNQADKSQSIQAIKDEFIVPLIERYGLDMRKRMFALEAWRKLYFIYYETKQVVTKIE